MPAQDYSAPAWGASPYEDMDLPSGAHIQVKRLELLDVVKAGLMNEMDALSPIVEEKVIGPAKGKRPSDRQPKKLTKAQQKAAEEKAQRDFLGNTEQMDTIIRVMSKLLPIVVVQPSIVSDLDDEDKKIPPSERTDGLIYVDSVPLADQMTIFGWLMQGMDMEGLKQFREESESDVGDVEGESESPRSTG